MKLEKEREINMLKEIKKFVGRTKNGTLNAIEDMVININNNYKIEQKDKIIILLKSQLEMKDVELKEAKSDKKKMFDYLKKAGELLKASNEIAKENHALKKPTKKDLKLESMGKVSSDAKAKMK